MRGGGELSLRGGRDAQGVARVAHQGLTPGVEPTHGIRVFCHVSSRGFHVIRRVGVIRDCDSRGGCGERFPILGFVSRRLDPPALGGEARGFLAPPRGGC